MMRESFPSEENEHDFIVEPDIEPPKQPIVYEREEIAADIFVFPEKTQPLVQKFLKDESGLTAHEAAEFREARAAWWEEKYGFPYHRKLERREVLSRKYAPAKEVIAAHALQEGLIAALGRGETQEAAKLKQTYQEKYPHQQEGIETLFGLIPFLELSKRVNTERIADAHERRRLFEELTEYQFLITHFLEANGDDKQFLKNFWHMFEELAARAHLSRECNVVRRGVITQVATFRIFKELGFTPALSHPEEDAFQSIDLWSDAEHPVQVKSTSEEKPDVVATDEISFPGVEIKRGNALEHFTSKLFHDAQKFKVRVEAYRKASKKENLKGYFMVVPYAKVDFITGEPDRELVELVRRKLKV